MNMSNPPAIPVQRRAYLEMLRGKITPAEYLRVVCGHQR